jgi:hypothetical protein
VCAGGGGGGGGGYSAGVRNWQRLAPSGALALSRPYISYLASDLLLLLLSQLRYGAAGVCIVISVSGRLAKSPGRRRLPARWLAGLCWLIELCPLLFSSVRRCIIKSNQSSIVAQILLACHASEQRLTANGRTGPS